LENVRYANADPMDAVSVKDAIATGEAALKSNGRLLIRKSGTEPLVRVMGECEDAGLLKRVVGDIAAAVKAAA
jgi:phosphoglucosamine mutase